MLKISIHSMFLLAVFSRIYSSTAQRFSTAEYKCPDRKTICKTYESCVTWERGCSLGANCLQPGLFETFSECVKPPVNKVTLLPSKPLCSANEVFARSLDKSCPKPSCPLRLGYNCYPSKGTRPTCFGTLCPFGMTCMIGEGCNDFVCEPQPICTVIT